MESVSLCARGNSRVGPVRVTGCDDDGTDAGGGKSDVRGTYSLGERNNTNTDSLHTDSSGRTGVDSTRRDNN